MLYFSANNLTKHYGANLIFKEASFHIAAGERIGLVGKNGAGKTTLCNIIAGLDDEYDGACQLYPGVKVAYFRQLYRDYEEDLLDKTVFDYILSTQTRVLQLEEKFQSLMKEVAESSDPKLLEELGEVQTLYEQLEGYSLLERIEEVLKGLGIEEEGQGRRNIGWHSKLKELSGGERKLVELATILLDKESQLLILDEPTNHLDLEARIWLQDYVSRFTGTVLIVSHDRFLLNQVAEKVFEIEDYQFNQYNGNYDQYERQKQERFKTLLKKYSEQQKELTRLKGALEGLRQRVLAGGGDKIVGLYNAMKTRVAKYEAGCIPDPRRNIKEFKIDFPAPGKVGQIICRFREVDFSFDNSRQLFKDMSLFLGRGQKAALLGANGSGKTTLFKMILTRYCQDHQLNPTDFGLADFVKKYGQMIMDLDLYLGPSVKIGYYSQTHSNLEQQLTIRQLLQKNGINDESKTQGIYKAFMFEKKAADNKEISYLSGGEKSRLQFLQIMLSKANFLLLDEPVNHLDIPSMKIIEKLLADYKGTILTISHDRYFLDKVVERIFYIEDKKVGEFLGSYSEYVKVRG